MSHEVIQLTPRRKRSSSPPAPRYAPATPGAAIEAENLLRLAQQHASIYRTFTTQIGLDLAEALKREMRAILERQ